MRNETKFTDSIQRVLNNARASGKEHVVRFVDARMLNVVDDMMLPNFLATNSKATNARHICVIRRLMKNEGVLPPLLSISMDAPVVKTLGITPVNDPGILISSREHILSWFKLPMHSKKWLQPHSCSRHVFLLPRKSSLWWTSRLSHRAEWRIVLNIRAVPWAKIQRTTNITQTISLLLTSTMRLFYFGTSDKPKKSEVKVEIPEKRLFLKVDRHFNCTERSSAKNRTLYRSAMRDIPQKKRSRKMHSSGVTKKL